MNAEALLRAPAFIFFEMNNIKIKFDPFQNKCTISMNDAPLPRYSSLNSYVNKPLLDVASVLLQTIGDELNDDFTLSVIGTRFEQKFLEDLRKNHPDCVAYKAEEFGIGGELKERYESTHKSALELSAKIGNAYKEKIFSEVTLQIDDQLVETVSGSQEATLCVADSLDSAKQIMRTFAGQLMLCISDTNKIISLNGNKYIWCLNQNEIQDVVNAVIERFSIPRYINYISELANEVEDVQVQEIVNQQKKIDIAISVQMDTTAIEGDYITPVFSCQGGINVDSIVRMESSNNNIAEVQGTKVYAVREGKTEIRFYKENEIDAFDVVVLTIKPDNLVKSISLSIPEKIKTGNTYTIQTKYVPSDAPDFKKAKWCSSDNEVVEVNQDGTFTAVKEGDAIITVETERATATIDVTVLPSIKKINLSTDKVHMYIGEKQKIDVHLEPKRGLQEEICAKSSKPNVAEIFKNDIGEWIIVAKGIEATGKGMGNCKIVFSSEDGMCQSECHIIVESTMKRNEKRSGFLSRTAIFTVLAFVLQFITKPLGYYCGSGLATVAILLGLIGIVKNRKDVLWQIILMIISALIAFLNIAILMSK